jgi:hypothetical protein
MPRWFAYRFTDAGGAESDAVLEAYSNGASAWFTPAGDPFTVPVPGTNVVLGEIASPAWAHPDPAPWAPPPPRTVAPRQARIALNAMGLRQQVEDAVAAAGQDIQDTWEFATVIDRDHWTFQALAAELGFTEELLDELFRTASEVQ